jgi:hypothetical protein
VNPNDRELLRLSQLLTQAPGRLVEHRLRRIRVSERTFERNAEELQRHIDRFVDTETAIDLVAREPREQLDEYVDETIRLLHNFLASVRSLVDHTRVEINEAYGAHVFSDQYQKRVESDFSRSPHSQFVHQLRHYALHVGNPPTQTVVSWSPGGSVPPLSFVRLSRRALLEWDKWNEPARRFVSEMEGDIHLRDLVETYSRVVREFYEWMGSRLLEIHRDELDELRDIRERIASMRGDSDPAATVLGSLKTRSRPRGT